MKKQILFMMFLSLAFVFAGLNKSFGQVDDPQLDAALQSCPVPAVLNCGDADALSPLPGETYLYEIDVASGETPGNTIHWFVTTNTDLITTATLTTDIEAAGGTYVLTAGTTANGGNASYNDGTNTGDILEVTWNYFDPSETVLLVAFVVDADGCTNNIEAYKIEPVFNFVLEIAALEDNGVIQDPADVLECVSPVQEAIYNEAAGTLDMDYGDNYIYYVVTAANFVHSWDPTFTEPTSTGGSTVGTVEWTYNDGTDLTGATWYEDTEPVLAQDASGAVGADGECIILRINIDHGNVNEFIVSETYTTGVDGVMYSAATSDYSNGDLADLDDDPANPGTCINTITDEADYIITPRPDVNAVDPTPFVPKD
jgi:hypothetical protein